jgi:hypothetical protein
MKVSIRNQCSDFKLRCRSHFSNSIDWNTYPDEEVDAGSMTNAILTSYSATFEGILTYQLQRKRVESDDQLESTSTLLFITWKSEGYKELRACIRLIEYDKQVKWDGYKLKEYYKRYANQFSTYTGPIEDTWLMPDGTVLMTRLELDFTQRDGVLNIIIFKGVENEYTRRPVWLDPKM